MFRNRSYEKCWWFRILLGSCDSRIWASVSFRTSYLGVRQRVFEFFSAADYLNDLCNLKVPVSFQTRHWMAKISHDNSRLTNNMPHGEELNAFWKIKTKEKMLITFRIWSESSIDKSKYCNQAIGALLNRFFQCRWCIILNLDTLCSCVKCVNGKNKATTTWSAEPKVVPLNYNIREQGGRIRQQ